MKAAPLALLGLLLAAGLPPPALAAPADEARVEPASGHLATRFRFEGPAGLLGPNLLENPRFEGLASWSAASEVGAEARAASAGNGTVVLRAGPAASPGTVHLRQAVAVQPGPLDFHVRARVVEGQVARLLLLLRLDEPGGARDVVVPVAPRGGEWVDVDASLAAAPGARGVTVFLRYELAPGQSAAVAFAEPMLRRAPAYAWTFSDGVTVEGRVAERTFGRPGAHWGNLTIDGKAAASRQAQVTNAPPAVAFDLVQTDRAWVLDGRRTADPDGRQLLRNGDFRDGAAGWILDTPEVDGNATMEAAVEEGRGVLRVRAGERHPAGTVWAYQEVRGAPRGAPLELQVDVRDDGNHAGYEIVLREQGPEGTRDVLVPGLPGESWRTLGATWAPRASSTHLFVQLRFRVDADQAALVEFANVSLAPARQWAWSVDGRVFSREPVAPWPPGVEGHAQVRLEVVDEGGARGFAVRNLTAPPVLEGSLFGPRLVRANGSASWSAADVRFPALELLRNGGFGAGAAGWRLDATEIGGNATFDVEDGAARLDFHAARDGTVYLTQDLPLDARGGYDLSLLRRDTGVLQYGVLLRESGFNQTARAAVHPWHDTLWVLPSTPGWDAASRAWKPAFNDSTHLTVFLRVFARAGDNATVWFDNASLAPARSVAWTLDGAPAGTGAQLHVARLPPGRHVLAAEVRAGERAARVQHAVQGVESSVDAHPTLDGLARLSWRVKGDGLTVAIARDGAPLAREGPEGVLTDAPEPGRDATYVVEAVAPDGERLRLAEAAVRPGAFAHLRLDPEAPTRGETVQVRVRVLDPTVKRVWLLAAGDEVPLVRNASSGAWEGGWTVPRRLLGDAPLAVVAANATAEGAMPAGETPVRAFAAENPLPWVGLAALAAALAWAAPGLREVMLRRRGG